MRLYISTVLCFFLFSSLSSQKIWSLEECIVFAIDNNLQAKSVDNNLKLSEIDVIQSKHSRYPSFGLGSNLGWNFGRTIDPTRNEFITQSFFNNGISVNSGVILFNGFRIQNTIDQAIINNQAVRKDQEHIRNDIALNVATAYLNVLFAKENKLNAEVQLNQTIDQKNLLNKLILVGNRPENDILDLDAQIAQNEQNLIVADNNLNISLLTLRQLMRLESSIPFDIVSPIIAIEDSTYNLLEEEEVFQIAIKNQRNIEAANLRIRAAEVGEKIAASAQLPSINTGFSLGTNYSNRGFRIAGFREDIINQDIIFQGQEVEIGFPTTSPIIESTPYFDQISDNLSYGVGVSLNIPIYSNYNIRANKQRAQINTLNAKNNLEILSDNFRSVIMQSFAEAKAAKSRYNAAINTFKAQENLYNNSVKRFEIGALNSFDLVRVKSLMESSEINSLIAKYDYYFRLKVLDFYLGKPLKIN